MEQLKTTAGLKFMANNTMLSAQKKQLQTTDL